MTAGGINRIVSRVHEVCHKTHRHDHENGREHAQTDEGALQKNRNRQYSLNETHRIKSLDTLIHWEERCNLENNLHGFISIAPIIQQS